MFKMYSVLFWFIKCTQNHKRNATLMHIIVSIQNGEGASLENYNKVVYYFHYEKRELPELML